jgi:hypothetical protein
MIDGNKGKLGFRGEVLVDFNKTYSRRFIQSDITNLTERTYIESAFELDHSFDDSRTYMNLQLRNEFIADHDEFIEDPMSAWRIRYHFIQDMSHLLNSLERLNRKAWNWISTSRGPRRPKAPAFKPGTLHFNPIFDYSFTLNEYMVQSWLWYKVNKNFKVESGINYFGGDTTTDRYSQFDDNDEMFLKVKYEY